MLWRVTLVAVLGELVFWGTVHAQEEWQTIQGGPDTQCALDDPYSFFGRLAEPDSLLVFFGGGGACWDAISCGAGIVDGLVPNTSARPYNNGLLDITNDLNPFKNYSMLVVPYCTGDVQLGSRTIEYERRGALDSTLVYHHVGARNARAALDWIREQVPSPEHIVVAGQSAGAIPTPYFAAMLARQHPSARVVQVGDGAGALRAPRLSSFALRHWGADSMLVADGLIDASEAAAMTFEDLYVGAVRVAPNLQIAQVNSAADETQSMFLDALGLGDVPVSKMLAASMSEIETAVPDFRFFVVDGDKHVFLSSPDIYETTSEGVRLLDWIADLAQGREVVSVGRALLSPSETGDAEFSVDDLLGVWETRSINGVTIPGTVELHVMTSYSITLDLQSERWTFSRGGECSYMATDLDGEEREGSCEYSFNPEQGTITIVQGDAVGEGSIASDEMNLTFRVRGPPNSWVLEKP